MEASQEHGRWLVPGELPCHVAASCVQWCNTAQRARFSTRENRQSGRSRICLTYGEGISYSLACAQANLSHNMTHRTLEKLVYIVETCSFLSLKLILRYPSRVSDTSATTNKPRNRPDATLAVLARTPAVQDIVEADRPICARSATDCTAVNGYSLWVRKRVGATACVGGSGRPGAVLGQPLGHPNLDRFC